jgi:hypothetical protein
VSSTALLFFFRVRAIYDGNRYVTAAFFIMWLSVLGGSLTVVTTLSGAHIGNTKYCTSTGFKPYVSAANITIAIFDTCVFLAISWRLLAGSPVVTTRDDSALKKSTLFGRYLPHFSRALFQDGQNYYMYVLKCVRVAMVCNMLVVITNYLTGIPVIYRIIFLFPSIALTNIMACYVFRHTKLSLSTEIHTVSTMFPQSNRTVPVFLHTSTTGSIPGSETPHTPGTSDPHIPSSGNSAEKLPQFSKEEV